VQLERVGRSPVWPCETLKKPTPVIVAGPSRRSNPSARRRAP